ncbi:hypothetical protein DXT76_13585 [Halobacillus trueperi]|uniref:Uncharacterized protein n=1 Tax=Halobacillus trueperi TaxID=156205 RepID=A0A3D8VM81_9BACI|nr:hypothetical protein [Halobacillus trueperi]RDY70301.1 hypothetical protein DXT76_13585 [Halobacillus trueperi]
MNKTKEERLETINKLIKFISKSGRRFFYTKSTLRSDDEESVAYMELKKGRIYFVDNYTKDAIAVINNHRRWNNFSHGGTLQALVMDFADFIRTGKSTNGKHGYGGLFCPHWGHADEIQQEIIDYAKEIGYLKS